MKASMTLIPLQEQTKSGRQRKSIVCVSHQPQGQTRAVREKSSQNASIFHTTWLDALRTALVHVCFCVYIFTYIFHIFSLMRH